MNKFLLISVVGEEDEKLKEHLASFQIGHPILTLLKHALLLCTLTLGFLHVTKWSLSIWLDKKEYIDTP